MVVTKYWVGYSNDDNDAKMVAMNWLELIKVVKLYFLLSKGKDNGDSKI